METGITFGELTNGIIIESTSNNKALFAEFNGLVDYQEKISFWETHNLKFVKYRLSDYNSKENEFEKEITIAPKNQEEWVTYYQWSRDKEVDRRKQNFDEVMNEKEYESEKEQFKKEEIKRIEDMVNVPSIDNEPTVFSKSIYYAYNCEIQGHIPAKERFGVDTDIFLIEGGVLYYLFHYITNYQKVEISIPTQKRGGRPKKDKLDFKCDANLLVEFFFKLKHEVKMPDTLDLLGDFTDSALANMIVEHCTFNGRVPSPDTILGVMNKTKRPFTRNKTYEVTISIVKKSIPK